MRVRIEDKGPIAAFHWRGAPDQDGARTQLEGLAHEAEVGRVLGPLGHARCWR